MQPWIRDECNSAKGIANTILQLSLWYQCYESSHEEDLRSEVEGVGMCEEEVRNVDESV